MHAVIRTDRGDPPRVWRDGEAAAAMPSSLTGCGRASRDVLHVEASTSSRRSRRTNTNLTVRQEIAIRDSSEVAGGNAFGCPSLTGTRTNWDRSKCARRGPTLRRATEPRRCRLQDARRARRRSLEDRRAVRGPPPSPDSSNKNSFPSADKRAVVRPVEPGQVLARRLTGPEDEHARAVVVLGDRARPSVLMSRSAGVPCIVRMSRSLPEGVTP